MPAPGSTSGNIITPDSVRPDFAKDFHFSMMIHAAPKVGKTWCAATASKKYVNELPLKNRVALDDVLWISFDEDATIGLYAEGFDVPHNIDVFKVQSDCGNIERAQLVIQRLATEILTANPQIKHVISDTDSGLDLMLSAYADELDMNGWDKYRRVLKLHTKNINMGKDLRARFGISTIRLCHSRASDPEDAKQKVVSLAARGNSSVAITPALTGQAGTLYMRDVSQHFALKKTSDGKVVKRQLITLASEFFDAGGRFERFLDPIIPAHLQSMYTSIQSRIIK